ncbi:MAG: CoA transferase [Parvularculaceae bacterium]
MVIAVGNDGQFRAFTAAIGLAEIGDDVRFKTNRARVANREALIGLIAPRLCERTTAQWLHAMEAAKIPAGPINSIDAVFADAQAKA